MTVYPPFAVVLVDDESAFLSAASFALRRDGITNVETIDDSCKVMDRLAKRGCGVLVLDITMPVMSGREILKKVAVDYPDICVIMITAVNDVLTGVECMKLGARDYILKPLQPSQLIAATRKAIDSRMPLSDTLTLDRYQLNNSLKCPGAFKPIITNNTEMYNIFRYTEAIAPTGMPVLITGETGTGKEFMAKAIHDVSGRSGNFLSLNLAGVDDNVLSDTLFGHVHGAFTGADRDRKGMIEESADGTLFCDEIGDLRPESQVKLLRLLQEGTFHPLGSDVCVSSRTRMVFATNRDLKAMIHAGTFRHDLYFRLQAHEIKLPPLRERPGDICLLAAAIVKEAAKICGKRCPHINQELFPLLLTYSWPGNIRELKSLLFDAVSRNETDTLSLVYLKSKISELRRDSSKVDPNCQTNASGASNGLTILFPASIPTASDVERLLILETLRRTGGNKTLTAELLGLSRPTVIKRCKEKGNE